MTPDETKAVLAMSKKEQRAWLLLNVFHERMPRESTADLAFRLRDEAVKENKEGWLRACYEVDNIAGDYKDGRIYNRNNGYTAEYNILKRSPIHWILAALKAKGEE